MSLLEQLFYCFTNIQDLSGFFYHAELTGSGMLPCPSLSARGAPHQLTEAVPMGDGQCGPPDCEAVGLDILWPGTAPSWCCISKAASSQAEPSLDQPGHLSVREDKSYFRPGMANNCPPLHPKELEQQKEKRRKVPAPGLDGKVDEFFGMSSGSFGVDSMPFSPSLPQP